MAGKGKRTAISDLNHTNWDEEDEPEEAGTFSKASEDVIKNRVIRVAKRRNPIGSATNTDSDKKGVFANFGGFSKPTTPSSPSFNFLTNLNNTSGDKPKTNGIEERSSTTKIISPPSTMFKMPENETSLSSNLEKSKEYYAKLKGLNQSVCKWIKKHVDSNPLLNLTPIFKDYEKYLAEIEAAHKDEEKEPQPLQSIKKITESKTISTSKETTVTSKSSDLKTPEKKTNAVKSIFSSSVASTKSTEETTEPKQSFMFGSTLSSPSLPSSSFSFGKPTTSPSTSAGFSFGGDTSKPFTFANVSNPVSKEDKEEESDEPPNVEFTPVVEKDFIYSTRCKVFVKHNDVFGDRGVGTLYLKTVPNSSKTQVFVRADTNLGNLLCNFILAESIPMQRMGKKDVMLVCIPTQDSVPPPVPVLFRVKSPEEADDLLKILEKHKK